MNAKAPNPHKAVAAQQAQTGLITVNDLSLLTGVDPAKLNLFAKKEYLKSYHEYHGKRFFNFVEVLEWLFDSTTIDEAKQMIRTSLERELQAHDCPYTLVIPAEADAEVAPQIVWKDLAAA